VRRPGTELTNIESHVRRPNHPADYRATYYVDINAKSSDGPSLFTPSFLPFPKIKLGDMEALYIPSVYEHLSMT